MSDLTREEAISTLEMLRNPEPWEPKLSKRAEEALDIAIGIIRECGESSVSPENKEEWIPVSEENLPEDFQKVLITIKRYDSSRVVREAEYHENLPWAARFSESLRTTKDGKLVRKD